MPIAPSLMFATGIGALSWGLLRHCTLPRGAILLLKAQEQQQVHRHWQKMVAGHRGAHLVPGIPENTLSAFKYARAHGADAVELDLRLSADGHLVVFHDPILKLSKNVRSLPPSGETNVEKLTLEELEEVEVLCNDGEQQNSSEKTADTSVRAEEDRCIPPFDQVLEWGRDMDMRLILDLKELPRREDRDQLTSLLADFFMRDGYLRENAIVVSKDPRLLYRLRQINPDIPVGLGFPTAPSELQWGSFPLRWAFMHLLPWTLVRDVLYKRLLPWFLGVSFIAMHKKYECPKEVEFWTKRQILFYSWGWEKAEEVTEETASSIIVVSGDYQAYSDALAQFKLQKH